MNKEYYYRYYQLEREHWWFRAREAILKSYITSNIVSTSSDIRILNIGAATGRSSEWLSAFGEVTSIEYERECIEFVRGKISVEIQHGSILSLDFNDAQFDLVCAFDVIEHVQDDQLAVSEMMRVCKPTGHILVTVPADMNLWGPHDEINHHFRRYSKDQLEALFSKRNAGHIEFSSYFNSGLYPAIRFARKLGRLKQRLFRRPVVESDFDMYQVGFLERFFYEVMMREKYRLSARKNLGKGVSILLHWRSQAL